MVVPEQPCSVLINVNLADTPSEQSLKQDFEHGKYFKISDTLFMMITYILSIVHKHFQDQFC